VLCAQPGDLFAVRRVRTVGTRSSLSIDGRSLEGYAGEHHVSLSDLELVPQAQMSPQLGAHLTRVFRAFRGGRNALEVQSALVEFVAHAVEELSGHRISHDASTVSTQAAQRIRERLESDWSEVVNLTTLAEEVGLSRFATLRTFKQHFGVPPHAYQLRLRLELSRRSLRHGLKPADVAAEFGFVDQSHLTRHFRRLFGITPAEYARVGRSSATVPVTLVSGPSRELNAGNAGQRSS
jgi:AraC-like DNA-binding protein